MAPKIGYLLPTRESIMGGRPAAGPLLALGEKAEKLGYDSIWVGDSLLAKPRHDPLTLLAAAAARTKKVALGTAVLLPILRNPVVLAHQVATLDQISEGRVILGVGIGADSPPIRAEHEAAGVPFEKRAGRMMELIRLCRALWSGEPVDWDGRWTVKAGMLGPTPYRKGGPLIWGGGSAPGSLKRAATEFDGWFPSGPSDFKVWGRQWREVQEHARAAGRNPSPLTGAIYLTVSLDEDAAKAEARLNKFLEDYYLQPAEGLRRRQAGFAGPARSAAEWMQGFLDEGASHLMLRFVGEHERHLEACAELRGELRG